MNRQEFNALMQQRARESRAAMAAARPAIPYGDQVRVCDMWRAQAKAEAELRARLRLADRFAPARTALGGRPWEDLA
jgi:hypothetical protein